MKVSSASARALMWIAGVGLFLSTSVSAKAILGVDLGSLYMKVALVQRGAPLEIVTNMHSKRKTEQMILFDQGTRFYGADASSLLARKPTKTPGGMSVLLGRDEDHPSVKVLSERHYPIIPVYNETRKGLNIPIDGGKQSYSPEELTAMVLHYAEEITHHYGKEKGNTYGDITDCVLTVPSFATQAERRALLDAAELAGFKVLSLIDENTASALNFGMDKTFEEPQIYLFYNMGASSLQVSVVKFHSYEVPESKYSKKMKRVGSIEVLGKGWDATLGGMEFDNRIVEYMADHFNREWRKARGHDKDIRDIPRAMTKLRLQANKVKHVLSANQEIPVHVDSLHDDMSLSIQMTRTRLEELCDDLMERAVAPVHSALVAANLTLDDVTAIELIGGGMRVPKVQSGLAAVLGEKELGMHINSDESMALGAAFFGANISTAFKVRQVGLTDINPFPISISLENLESDKKTSNDKEVWSKQATVFKTNGKIAVKKTIAFTHDEDVHCALDYAEPETLPTGSKPELQRYKIKGIAGFAKEMEEKGLGKPKVSLQFELSQSGITSLIKAEAAVEETYTVEVEVEVEDDEDKSSNETDAADETTERKTEETKDASAETTEQSTEEAEKADNETKAGNATKDTEKPKKKTKMVEKEMKKTHKKVLDVEEYHVGKIQPLSKELKEEYKFNIAELARMDKERMLLEEAKNQLESYIYKVKNKLSDEEEKISKISTEEQREELSKLTMAAEDWLFDEGDSADVATVKAKYEELAKPAEKVWFRLSESTARPEAVQALKDKLKETEEKLNKWFEGKDYITDDEKADLASKFEAARKWVADKEDEQAAKASHEDPAFSSEEVPGQMQPIMKLVTRLMKKPKPKVEKLDTADNKTSAETNETVKTNETEKVESTSDEKDAAEETVPDGEEL
ncbi:molecular chaperone DnaK [Nitzschia inconspicua]|uniref:Molecular chaperone DnaK n=1 Tax=Nitzschia inconspicua TaxID=303405 RepID=A0A9K3PDX0_9STRA|nr:molecular chaperone DnaK [Nitzschia inconspicua]